MEIFNIGIGELLVILVLMYVLLGPEGMLKAAHWAGKTTQQAYRFFNETWRSITDAPMDIRDLPRALLDETGLKETYDEIQKETRAARSELNRAVGDLNAPLIKPPAGALAAGKMAGKPEPEAPAVPENLAADAALVGPPPEPAELPIRPAPEAVAADLKLPGPAWTEEPLPEEAPKRKRGRPRKDEVRPPQPEPAEPRKRGRPRKNRPEATAAEEVGEQLPVGDHPPVGEQPPVGENPPVKERPTKPRTRLPRKAPSQPGDPIVPVDLNAEGAQTYATQPAPSTDEEHHDPHAA